MSKTDTSLGPLVGILRFNLPAKSTRTLNATQAFDTTSSGITLGSSIGSLSDMTSKQDFDAREKKNVIVSALISGNPAINTLAENFQGVEIQTTVEPLQIVRLFVKAIDDAPMEKANELKIGVLKSRFIFEGVKMDSLNPGKNITIYDGVITLGLGEYKKWQDKYAVLKTNTVTEKAILRIYAN